MFAITTQSCVIGGSCTGLFAAVAAGRLGAKVAIVEYHDFFGNSITPGLLNLLYRNFPQHKMTIVYNISGAGVTHARI